MNNTTDRLNYNIIGSFGNDQDLLAVSHSCELALFNAMLAQAFSFQTTRNGSAERLAPIVREGNKIFMLSNGQWVGLRSVAPIPENGEAA